MHFKLLTSSAPVDYLGAGGWRRGDSIRSKQFRDSLRE